MLKQLGFGLIVISCISCFTVDCDELEESHRLKECNMIIKKLPGSGRYFNIGGINPITGEWNNYVDVSSWYVEFNQDISIGDTLVKHRGELKFFIHKKDTVLVFPFECGGRGTNRVIN